MKISIERAVLLKAVSQAQSVVERRNTIPILANVLIEAEGDGVTFRATDLDIEVVDKYGWTALHCAAYEGHREVVREALD